MEKDNTENVFFTMLIKSYEAQKAQALAMLSLNFANPTEDALAKLRFWTEKLTKAESNIKTLNDNFVEKSEELIHD